MNKTESRRGKIGRPVTVGDERINLFISPEDRMACDKVIDRAQSLHFKTKLSLSYLFREGARQLVKRLNVEMDALPAKPPPLE